MIIVRRKNSHNRRHYKSAHETGHVEMNRNCCLILHEDEEHEERQQSLSVWHLAAGVAAAAADKQLHQTNAQVIKQANTFHSNYTVITSPL